MTGDTGRKALMPGPRRHGRGVALVGSTGSLGHGWTGTGKVPLHKRSIMVRYRIVPTWAKERNPIREMQYVATAGMVAVVVAGLGMML